MISIITITFRWRRTETRRAAGWVDERCNG